MIEQNKPAPTLTYLYLRASTKEQDASRAEHRLREFAADPAHNLLIVGAETENESGAQLNRPALFKILNNAPAGAAILVEQVDRLSRLNNEDWRILRGIIESKQIRVIALDLPTSYMFGAADKFTAAMLQAINGMMLDMLAAIARKDYEDRRRRQAEGIAKAKREGRNITRPVNYAAHAEVIRLFEAGGYSKAEIAKRAKCSLATVKRVLKAHQVTPA